MQKGLFLSGQKCCLRSWEAGDEEALAKLANNEKVWKNLLDEFPHPYTIDHAKSWISMCQDGPIRFANVAICLYDDSEKSKLIPIGGIGVHPSGQSINKKRVKQVGYWIGESYWGRGIVTEALQLITNYAFSQECADAINDGVQIVRLEAAIFAYNVPSGRVLEKAGYHLEAVQKAAYVKLGQVQDAHLYVKIRDGI
eukprot:TRINITY_DN12649_c0_g1_i1.p1 TRINITY_DN12649_c0_g1~~TRINITY_DN12649_c0_g1_i1.p1  ORF type:complete len:197 (-),score=22.21 TRINITY_DN12649_c0_g1_i1:76-666(-)